MKKILKRFPLLLCGLFFLAQAPVTSASDIVEVLPLTDQILLVHFDDGHVIHHKFGESRNSDVLVSDPLNLVDAMKPASYSLASTDDSNYTTAKNPSQVGRKSKGTDYVMSGPRNNTGWAEEHWVYLHLPNKMVTGKNYTLATGSLAKDKNSFTFTFNEKNLRSEAVKVNQAGYIPSAKTKMGYVYHWMGDKGGLSLTAYAGKKFSIIDHASGDEKFSGTLAFRKAANNEETGQSETPKKNFLNAEVYECDFSAFNTPGRYRLVVEGIGCSFPFTLDDDIYRASFKTTARGLYHNRSGLELTTEYTEHRRPAPHNPNLTPGFENRLRYSTTRSCDVKSDGGGAAEKKLVEDGDKGPINTWGWYQDAGDWDGYPSHLRIPALLLLAYEMAPEKFTDNELNIPGKGNSIPDILDEARWLIEYLHRTRHAIMDAGYGTGGVSGRVCGDYWGGDTDGSWIDIGRTWYVWGEDPMNTYMYAGLASHYAYLLKLSGMTCSTGINWEQEAISAYNWAKDNTRAGDEKAPEAQISLGNTRLYAAANLYKLTGKNEYHARFIKDSENIGSGTDLGEDMRLGVYSYLLLSKADNTRTQSGAVTRFKGATAATANIMVNESAGKRACRWGGNFWMPMLVGQGTTPWVIDGVMDYYINNAESTLTNVITTLDYFMGTNPLNHIWFTGEISDIANKERRHVRGAFHLDSWYNIDKADREVPGFAPYGPWVQQTNISAGSGWWQNEYPFASAYPKIKDAFLPLDNSDTAWPGHELWFDFRYSPLSCENTVHQNTVHWAVSTGLLCKNVVANPYNVSRLPAAEAFAPIVEVPEPEGDALLIADFDTKILYPNGGGGVLDGCFGYFNTAGTLVQPTDNPDKTGINTSNKVMKFTKAGQWVLIGLETKNKVAYLDISKYAKFRFKIKGTVSQFLIQFNDANKPEGQQEIASFDVNVSIEGDWKVYSLDISEKTGMFSNINIFPNPQNTAENVFYFDDIELVEKAEAGENETPNVPQNLRAVETAGAVELSWDAVTNAPIEKYEVYRFIVGEEAEFTKLTETAETSVQLTDLNLSKAYVFAVKAISKKGLVSALSSPLRIPIVPNDPGKLSALEAADDTAVLSWNAVTNTSIAKYEVWRRIVGEDDDFVKLSETVETSLQLTGIDPAKTYIYAVKAISERGAASALSSSINIPIQPGAPTKLRMMEDTGNDLVLTWDAVTNTVITKYEIYRRIFNEETEYVKIDETEDLSYKITGLYASKVYHFTVKAVSIKGLVSSASNSQRVAPTISVDDAEVSIQVHPNPVASGELVYIGGLTDGVAYTAAIFDSVGNELGRQPVASDGAVQVNLNAGIYFIRVTSPSTPAQTITIAVY